MTTTKSTQAPISEKRSVPPARNTIMKPLHIIAVGLLAFSAPPAHAQNNWGVDQVQLVYSAQQCRDNYRTLHPFKLLKRKCFTAKSPFGQCVKNTEFEQWESETRGDCLTIIANIVLNPLSSEHPMGPIDFDLWRSRWAFYISRNALFMETLPKLDQLQIVKVSDLFERRSMD